eukprot:gnl/TRDRNA2_/TRDRNA2_87353_c0_seq1.p1 gnl/TRDRNA2_/TRDRNA2_87353_c0~~gnl/TRDRNA2_/TRDRNA2_87353_c0_seq1.p1  ORF type:complete len:311 (-),score=31.88 gnl/TRDRNA2_/TRDRNA2_87353_c0_seq1:85-1017(-)
MERRTLDWLEPLLRRSSESELPTVVQPDAGSAGNERPQPHDRLAHLVLALFQAAYPARADDARVPLVAELIYQIRHRILLGCSCTALASLIFVGLWLDGVVTYISTDQSRCEYQFRTCLLIFLLVQPGCFGLFWCIFSVMLLGQPAHCSAIRDFLERAAVLQMVQLSMFFVVAIIALTVRPTIQRIREILTEQGTDPEVLRRVAVVPEGSIPAEDECAICLSRHDETEADDVCRWRQLICGHKFHEPCLLEWLAHSHICPLCRCNLHEAYGLSRGMRGASGATTSSDVDGSTAASDDLRRPIIDASVAHV